MVKALKALRSRKGTAIPYIAVVVFVLLGIASFAVDFAYVQITKSQLRTALDAASLAGASGLMVSPAQARVRAKAVALANTVNGTGLVLLDSDIQLGTWNSTTKAFTVLTGASESNATAMRITARLSNARGTKVNLMFAKLLGQNYVEMQNSSVGGFASGADVVIVQDVTSSFEDELADAKIGDKALLDALYNAGGKGGLGIVAHTGWGSTIAPLQKVNSNHTNLTNKIAGLKLCGNSGMPVCSGTDPASGLLQARTVFNAWATPSTTGKAIVLVSDGEPTSSSNGSHPNKTDAQMLTYAQTEANACWAAGIHVYVVFFNRDNSVTAANKIKTLIRGKGDFVQVTNASLLPAALEDITKKLPMQLCK